ncbi:MULTISPECIES: 4-hydroxy-tetrahydrodipicolinate synthase [Pseudobutyrivibrio]|jgi:4-hydroxy-tetrahydrodipicolinate synthase|uniref:4-hydroxy-tetrahydrodipicolinate synthase n=4 Tax=Pseudobutyrivibrio TaxID=46205 RepID=A0A2G3ECN2_9FIRM|nr:MULTISPECIES: 4-hydroxy-tetrahydrodipicolinate synthase [Pseudobutyrivibrio]MBE5903568.1 4-hydroxy-tetrahydrodipicolinate synthase [Pseudobutyrivibrio sp.]NEX01898.1 4-hydroxy-tetrahydrodipicolinate synthase [Pseudobutyrivibrio xylanivorans]PHU36573.1 4-hydroxy-tetrahydrodipicolinate synthase [Pseudobutyrivibrio ruminis]PHU40967.1 4-hydroxy-tetrahydrodipicolinate synthase [Pseudobutyrivibrio ruminis]SCY24742.1 4-hydroxy-tetrahydrodipicolinate synthase [Pseudobutyrivibrio sp. AR14]
MTLFKGAGVALITPFNEDDTVNYDMLGTLIDRQIEGHTDAIIVCGTTGEPATMSEEEKLSVIEFTVKRVNHRIPVIAGSGGNSTRLVIDFSKKIQALGVDGLLIVTPFYNKATQQGLYEHYTKIAHEIDLPIIMYNVPSRTGCNILPETAMRLGLENPNIVGIKEASGNISQITKLASLCRGCLDIYSGNDDQIIPILALGGIGVISVLSNVAPRGTHDMVMEYLNGHEERARKLQLDYLELVDALFCEVNPIPVKSTMNMLGFNVGSLRLPLTEMEDEHKVAMSKLLSRMPQEMLA